MKKSVHPKYYPTATVTCACGTTFTTGSTLETIQVEVCSKCHPYFTGKQKFLDAARRVEKFKERAKKTETAKATRVVTGKKTKHKVKDSKRQAKDFLKATLKEQ